MRHHIELVGSQILKNISEGISFNDICNNEDLKAKVQVTHEALADFRKENGFGRAIAAPQLGYNLRFISMNLGEPITLYNPEIIFKSPEKFSMWDDCLSFPNLMVCVMRHKSISIKYLNEKGEEVIWENCSQDISELLQHEIDHLDGILSLDIAVVPENSDLTSGIVDREEWLANKQKYLDMVDDYEIPFAPLAND